MIATASRASLPAGLFRTSDTTQAVAVLAVSGIAGFHAGMVTFPDWQVAVETAQVVAGIVHYPPDNPFYLYHLKLWTILHQICALLLRAGLSEIALSKAVSGLLGMVSFQAIAMIVYALSRDALLAVGSVFLIAFTRTAEYGVNYPIYLMGTPHTYGVIGLSLIALIAGLAGAGWYRTSGFLLGIAPAVHPSLGAWFTITMAAAVAWHAWGDRTAFRPAGRFLLLGYSVTAISLLAQLAQSRGVPAIDSQLANSYLTSFVSFWDTHRQPVSFWADGTTLTMGTLALAITWLKLSRDPNSSATLLLRLVIVTATLSLVLSLLLFLPPARLPSTMVILMPGRLVNFTALVAVAVLIGLLGHAWRNQARLWSALLLLYLAAGLSIGNRSMLWEWFARDDGSIVQSALRAVVPTLRPRPLQVLLTVAVLLVAGAVVTKRQAGSQASDHRAPAVVAGSIRVLTLMSRGALVILLVAVALLLWQWQPRSADGVFVDRTTNGPLARVAARQGILATGGDLQLIQLKTRRPVLINGGGLDGLPYALESGPALERVLRDVYAIDLLNPPEEARGLGAIPSEVNRVTWERFSPDRWQWIRRTYGVTQVLTPPGWVLALPTAVHDRGFVVYDIPE